MKRPLVEPKSAIGHALYAAACLGTLILALAAVGAWTVLRWLTNS